MNKVIKSVSSKRLKNKIQKVLSLENSLKVYDEGTIQRPENIDLFKCFLNVLIILKVLFNAFNSKLFLIRQSKDIYKLRYYYFCYLLYWSKEFMKASLNDYS